jgi:dephospho-CoA kinase
MALVIGLTGEKLSGKGTASAYLVKKYAAKHYRFSKILDDIIARLYLPKTRENQIDIALALREKFGNEIFAHVLKKDIEKDHQEISVIDGIRYWEEYHILKTLTGFSLLNITAPLEIRYQRTMNRTEKEDEKNMSLENFKKQENAPTEIIIKELAKEADYQIINDKSFDDLYKTIDDIMNKLQK